MKRALILFLGLALVVAFAFTGVVACGIEDNDDQVMPYIRGPDGVVLYAMDAVNGIVMTAAGDVKTDISAATAVILVNMTDADEMTALHEFEFEINEDLANTRGIPVLWVNGQEMNEAAYTNHGLVGRQQFDIAQAIAWAEKYSFDYVLTGKHVQVTVIADAIGLKENMVHNAPQLVVGASEMNANVINETVATARAPTQSTNCFVVKGDAEVLIAIKGNYLEGALVRVTANELKLPILATDDHHLRM